MSALRALLALCIVLSLFPLVSGVYGALGGISYDHERISEEIAMMQLRELLLIAYDLNVTKDALYFRYQKEEFRLSLVNRRMILQPGTQIWLNDLDALSFYEKEGNVYVSYRKKERTCETLLCPSYGFSLDDFPACVPERPGPDPGDERPSDVGQ